jgi:membrane associated rhomboid family serine protease
MFSITWIIIALTVITSILAFNKRDLLNGLMFNPFVIRSRREYYRMFTSGLIHADYNHLLFNMLTLYFFGKSAELLLSGSHVFGQTLGPWAFALLYILAIPMSSIKSYYQHIENPGYNALGASGAVSAVIFVTILLDPLSSLYVYFIKLPSVVFGILYLWYSEYMSRKGSDNVGHDAHFYGAIFGLLFCIVLKPETAVNFFREILSLIH